MARCAPREPAGVSEAATKRLPNKGVNLPGLGPANDFKVEIHNCDAGPRPQVTPALGHPHGAVLEARKTRLLRAIVDALRARPLCLFYDALRA